MAPETVKGRLIVIEGPDSSGKRTQAELLLDYFKKNGVDADYIEFPQYDSPFGALVAKYLRGEFGELASIPPEIPAILFALDRYQFKNKIEGILSKGTYLIANRYSESNLGYQAAKFSGEEKEEFIRWIDGLEERLPAADLIFYLNLPIAQAQELIAGRENKDYLEGRTRDIHEQDLEYQQQVASTYLDIARKRKDKWVIIECSEGERVKSREDVHEEIVKVVEDRFF